MAASNFTPRQYNPRDVRLLLGGAQVTDFMPGTMITISKNEDLIIPNVGVLGEVALAINQNNTGTLTISLKQTSPSHRMLSAFLTAVRAGGPAYFPVAFEDEASDITFGTFGWVQVQPDFALGQEVAALEWVIGLQDMQFETVPGANTVVDVITGATTL